MANVHTCPPQKTLLCSCTIPPTPSPQPPLPFHSQSLPFFFPTAVHGSMSRSGAASPLALCLQSVTRIGKAVRARIQDCTGYSETCSAAALCSSNSNAMNRAKAKLYSSFRYYHEGVCVRTHTHTHTHTPVSYTHLTLPTRRTV